MSKPSNILFITTDQQHWNTLGFLNPEVKTPNLDRLAARGTYFSRAYTVNPTCTPTRCSWITGTYPSQHGAYSLGTKLFEDVPTVNGEFEKGKYRTHLVGKAHFQPLLSTPEYPSLEAYPVLHDLEFWKNFNDRFYGFDTVELARNHTDESHAGQHYALWMESRGCKNWRDYFVPNNPEYRTGKDRYEDSPHRPPKAGGAWEIPEELHYNAWITERSNAALDEYKKSGERFFLWASFFDPHPPYMVPEPYASMYDPAKVTVPEFTPGEFDDKPPHFGMTRQEKPDFSAYRTDEGSNALHGAQSHLRDRETRAKHIATMYGMVTMLDTYIGKILDHLEALGLAENTLIVFTTDHGDFLGQHGLVAKALHHYEDLIKVPLIAALPGVIPAGTVSNELQSTVDLAPTFLSFAGLPVPRYMTGLDRKANWCGDHTAARRHVIVENHHNPTTFHAETLVNTRYKITVYRNATYGELFDLETDPGELVNLWDRPESRELKQELLLEFLQAKMEIEPMPMPRIAGA